MYSHGRKILTLVLTCLLVLGIIGCLSWQAYGMGNFLRSINREIESAANIIEFFRNETGAFQDVEIGDVSIELPANIIAFLTNKWFIAFLFALTACFPWFMRFIDWHFTKEEGREKRRRKIFTEINWEYRYHDRKNRPQFEDLKSFKGPDIIVGIILAVIFFVISVVFAKLNFLIVFLAFVPCFFAVFKSHERWTKFPKVETTGAPPIPGYENGEKCAYGGCH